MIFPIYVFFVCHSLVCSQLRGKIKVFSEMEANFKVSLNCILNPRLKTLLLEKAAAENYYMAVVLAWPNLIITSE